MREVRRFLVINGFIEIENNAFIKDGCSVNIAEDCYEVANSQGEVMYSPNLEIYWLIGVLTYFGYIPKNYKEQKPQTK